MLVPSTPPHSSLKLLLLLPSTASSLICHSRRSHPLTSSELLWKTTKGRDFRLGVQKHQQDRGTDGSGDGERRGTWRGRGDAWPNSACCTAGVYIRASDTVEEKKKSPDSLACVCFRSLWNFSPCVGCGHLKWVNVTKINWAPSFSCYDWEGLIWRWYVEFYKWWCNVQVCKQFPLR